MAKQGKGPSKKPKMHKMTKEGTMAFVRRSQGKAVA